MTSASTDQGAYQDGGSGTFNATSGDFVWAEEGTNVVLPTSPSDNDIVTVAQVSGDFSTTSAQVTSTQNMNFNGIDTAGTTLTLDANFVGNLTFIFNTSANVWKIA